jgi:hypothetical protein
MRSVLRLAVAAVFLASALLKAADLQATAGLVAATYSLSPGAARLGVAALVMLELAVAGALAFRVPSERPVALAVLALLALFTADAAWMLHAGVANCGCFGTRFALGPGATMLKNVALMGAVAVLYRGAAPLRLAGEA